MLETLNHILLFQDLNPDQIRELDPLFERLDLEPNSIIFAQDETAKYFYILVNGTATIEYKPYDGPTITITHLQPGDVFGWSAVVGSKKYTSSSRSTSHVEIVRVLATDLWGFVKNNPETGAFILNRIAGGVSSRWKDARTQVQAMLDNARIESNHAKGH